MKEFSVSQGLAAASSCLLYKRDRAKVQGSCNKRGKVEVRPGKRMLLRACLGRVKCVRVNNSIKDITLEDNYPARRELN